MLNLDGSRPNAARPEPELFIRLQEPGLFDPLFRRVIKAARLEGFSEAQVPDFLATLEYEGDLELFGQQELGPPEVTSALEEMLAQQRKLETSFGFTLTETSRLVEQRVRLAQHRFAAGVLANYRWQCGFCGFAPGDGLRGYRLLIASQVKPWARSNNRERSDVTNGVCACPMHDSAFDAGLLRLKPEMEIVRAKALESRLMKMNRWRAPSARPCCASRCLYLKLPSSRAISSSSTTKRSCFVARQILDCRARHIQLWETAGCPACRNPIRDGSGVCVDASQGGGTTWLSL